MHLKQRASQVQKSLDDANTAYGTRAFPTNIISYLISINPRGSTDVRPLIPFPELARDRRALGKGWDAGERY